MAQFVEWLKTKLQVMSGGTILAIAVIVGLLVFFGQFLLNPCESYSCLPVFFRGSIAGLYAITFVITFLVGLIRIPRAIPGKGMRAQTGLALIQYVLGLAGGIGLAASVSIIRAPFFKFGALYLTWKYYLMHTWYLHVLALAIFIAVFLLFRASRTSLKRFIVTSFVLVVLLTMGTYAHLWIMKSPAIIERSELARTQDVLAISKQAVIQDDLTLCKQIVYQRDRDNCVSMVLVNRAKQDSSLCEKIPSRDWRSRCYKNAAIATKDVSLCNKAAYGADLGDCIDEIAIASGDATLCAQRQESISLCYGTFVARLNQSSVCQLIPLSEGNTRYWCIINSARREEDCALLPADWQVECNKKLV